MNGPEDTPTVAYAGVPNFQLTPPQVITPVSADAARTAVPLKPEAARAVSDQVTRFIEALGADEPDSARMLGRDEIAHAAELMQQDRILQRDFIGAADAALGEIRSRLDSLNPAREGDLLAPQKLFGVIPLGNKLKAYLRRFESTGIALQASIVKLQAAREGVQNDIADVERTRAQLWAAMQQLAAAAQFVSLLDSRLSEHAQPMEQLRLHARQSLAGILGQQAVCVNAYLALDVLKKAGREWMNGCSRVETTLANLIREGARGPTPSLEQIREMFDQACKALDAMDAFCIKAIAVLAQNDTLVAGPLDQRPL
jgi:hypothetical protein